ncbi:MAG TPA: DinB family protein, partial [Candidatus Eisenbacteria bacterium]|nr:DinB family protein [Candidatus Eisenbacteria bacterium]
VLAGLRAGRDAVLAAAKRLGAEAARAPREPGKWSPREILLHLAAWDDWILEALPAARRNLSPPPMGAAAVNAFNARAVAAGKRLDWAEAVRRFRDRRARVLATLARVPASPTHVWSRGHAVGRLVDFVPEHDRHHAAQLAAAASPRAFAAQRRDADARGLVLFELQRARVAVLAAIQGLGAGSVDRPIAPGKWSPREIVLHLAVRDQVRLDEFDAILGGSAPSWAALTEAAMAEANERHLEPLRARSWDEAVRLLQGTRQRLLERVLAVPAEPEAVWTAAHPFGAMLRALPDHDRHHAAQVRNARLAG